MNTPRLSLAGEWICELDPDDTGGSQRWFDRLPGGTAVQLPGSLPAQRIGSPVTLSTPWTGTIFDRSFFEDPRFEAYRRPGQIKLPFWLQPDTVFVGPAWFARDFIVPDQWTGRRVVLSLERPHWETRVWIDGEGRGSGESLSVPHAFDLGCSLSPGKHRMTLRVDNRVRIEVGENAHSVSDHTQGNWNGVVGRIELVATDPIWIEDLQVFPQVEPRAVQVEGRVCAADQKQTEGRPVRLSIEPVGANPGPFRVVSVLTDKEGRFSARIELGVDAALWDEFSPALYRATARLSSHEAKSIVFGLRQVTAQGRALLLNGRTLFLRGTLDCCAYPKTGYPPTKREEWRVILGNYRSYGLNHVRFHSWCPPEAAFTAADELGMYLQIECASWANAIAVLAFNSPKGVGDGNEIDAWLYREGERILRQYGNHPSFILFASGNEPGGPHHSDYLKAWVRHFSQKDSRRLYTGAAGWPELPENQFQVIPAPRSHQWGDGLTCRINGKPPATTVDYHEEIERRASPVISHEIGQWTAYPTLGDIDKYTGHLRAKNYELFHASLRENGLDYRLLDFVRASGKLQALLYKEEIEACLRTAGLAGFQLLGLQDFPGQGTAPVGVIDVFGDNKGYLTAEEFQQFCGPTVLLVKLERRVFEQGDSFAAELVVAHFGGTPLRHAPARWVLCNEEGDPMISGELPPRLIETGRLTGLGSIEFVWEKPTAPARYTLTTELPGSSVKNRWDLWLYPKTGDDAHQDGCIATDLETALSRTKAGEPVLLLLEPKLVKGDVALGFSTIFWNTWCTQRQAPHTLGILCDPAHPAFALFPTDSHSNWQWWYLLQAAAAMELSGLPSSLRPIVQVIDDWFTNRRLALVFEARVGLGRLLVCSAALRERKDPVCRQFLKSLVSYVRSGRFQPNVEIAAEQFSSLLRGSHGE